MIIHSDIAESINIALEIQKQFPFVLLTGSLSLILQGEPMIDGRSIEDLNFVVCTKDGMELLAKKLEEYSPDEDEMDGEDYGPDENQHHGYWKSMKICIFVNPKTLHSNQWPFGLRCCLPEQTWRAKHQYAVKGSGKHRGDLEYRRKWREGARG